MAFNVGFAQVTVRPSFAGFQTEAKRAVNSQMPAVGAAAGAQMASGVKKAGAPAAKGFSETASKEMAKPETTTPFAGAGKRAGTAFIGSLKSALAPMAGIFAAAGISNFVKSTVNDASDLGEALNAVNVTFGKNAAGIKKLGEEAARSVGLSNVEFNSLAVRFSAFTDKIAGEGGDVVGIMKDLTGRASDFASVMNLEVNEAAQLFQSGLAGESEPLRRYGLDLSAAAVEAYAYANGIAKSGEQLTENQKIQARYALIMEQTAKMQGDFANTSDSLANSQRILKSEWTNLKAELGNNLIPVFERLVVWAKDEMIPAIRDLVNWIKENKDEIKAWAIAIGAAAVAFGVLKTALAITGWISEFTKATGAARLAMLGFNTALLANPIGLVIGALALLVGAVVLAYHNIEGFRNFVDTAWATIKKAISDAWENGIKPAFDAIKTWISDTLIPLFERFYRDVIVPVWDGIKWAIDGAWNSIKLIFDLIVWAVENILGKAFTWFLDAVIRPVWDAVRKKIEEVWDNVKPVLQALGDFVKDTLAPAIKKGIDKIKGFFDLLREAAAKPINFVIETVYNNGIRAVFEKVAKAIGSDARLPYASPIGWGSTSQGSSGGGAMRAFAKGGFAAPGLALVGEEGPELVDFRTPGRVYTADQTDELLRAAAGKNKSEAMLPMGDGIGGVFSSALSWIRGGLAAAASAVLNPIRSLLRGLGDSALGGIISGAALKAIDGLMGWIKGKDDVVSGPLIGNGWARPSRGNLTSVYGSRWGAFHNGIDYGGNLPVYAARDGVVVKTGWNSGYGNTGLGVRIAHGGGFETYYGHADPGEIRVKEGQYVKAGQWISMGGNTGNSTGQHLHFSIFKNGKSLNPRDFGIYDNGGWLTPGVQAVANLTGKPEAVLTDRQWSNIETLVADGGLGDVYHVQVLVKPEDLEGLKTVEQFVNNIGRNARMRKGA